MRRYPDWLKLGWLLAMALYTMALIQQPATVTPATAQAVIWGNTRSRIYHIPGCRQYPRTQPPEWWRPFATEGEAMQAGYRKALTCPTPPRQE